MLQCTGGVGCHCVCPWDVAATRTLQRQSKKVLLRRKHLLHFGIFATIWIPGGAAIAQPGGPYKVADVDGDSNLDVVTANYQARSCTLLMGVGDGTFENEITTPKGLRLCDDKWGPD